jgi:hypothetical protein
MITFWTFSWRARVVETTFFAEECITEELNNAFHTTPIQYSWNISLDKYMMNSDIKLFLMGIGYTSFDNWMIRSCMHVLNMRECWGIKCPSGQKCRSRCTMIEFGVLCCHCSTEFMEIKITYVADKLFVYVNVIDNFSGTSSFLWLIGRQAYLWWYHSLLQRYTIIQSQTCCWCQAMSWRPICQTQC